MQNRNYYFIQRGSDKVKKEQKKPKQAYIIAKESNANYSPNCNLCKTFVAIKEGSIPVRTKSYRDSSSASTILVAFDDGQRKEFFAHKLYPIYTAYPDIVQNYGNDFEMEGRIRCQRNARR